MQTIQLNASLLQSLTRLWRNVRNDPISSCFTFLINKWMSWPVQRWKVINVPDNLPQKPQILSWLGWCKSQICNQYSAISKTKNREYAWIYLHRIKNSWCKWKDGPHSIEIPKWLKYQSAIRCNQFIISKKSSLEINTFDCLALFSQIGQTGGRKNPYVDCCSSPWGKKQQRRRVKNVKRWRCEAFTFQNQEPALVNGIVTDRRGALGGGGVDCAEGPE